MDKNSLKTGMIVELRDGERYLVVNNAEITGITWNIGVGQYTWIWLDDYNDDLTEKNVKELDIVKVFSPNRPCNVIPNYFKELTDYLVIWKREDEEI